MSISNDENHLPLLYNHIHIQRGNIIIHNLRTSMNQRTHYFIKIHISHTLFSSVVCQRWVERHILRERTSSHIFFREPGRCQRLHPLASSAETPLVGCVSLTQLWFSGLCLNLTAWFSSRDLLLVTHLFDLSALIVLSCLLIKMWQLAKHTGSLGTNRKSRAYVI